MRRQIVGSIRAGETATRVAERLLDIDDPAVELPQHVEALRDAARFALERGDKNIYLEAVEEWRGRIERLGEGPARAAGAYTVRSATQALVKDLGKAKAGQVDEVVDRWVVERARHQARVVARTESVEAFRDVYKESTADQPYVVGYRWVLSERHARPDVCDVLASQDLDGLGPGGYLASSVPSNPHPSDLCTQVAIIDEQHFRRQIAKERGEPEPSRPWESGKRETGQEWLGRQSEAFQRRLLGPTRAAALRVGTRVIGHKGEVLPVHEVLGKPKPERRTGTRVAASAAIRRDRENQVIPFPRVPIKKAQ